MTVIFAPTSGGKKSAVLAIGAGTAAPINGTAKALTITPTTKDFGSSQVGNSGIASFTVTNPGSAAVSLAPAEVTGTHFDQFPIATSDCGSSLGAGASCRVNVIFKPTSAGSKTATLTVGDAQATLSGVGVENALTFSPSTLDFPTTVVGSTSSITVTLTNSYSAPLSINGWALTSSEFVFGEASTCTATLAASASCTVTVIFAPTSAGTKSAVLAIGAGTAAPINGTATQGTLYRINTGSSTVVSPFAGDQYFSGGTQHSVTNAINLSGVTNPAPAAVYQSERYGNITYTFPNLAASASHTVRLHFAELYWTARGRRVFNVAINGTNVLSNFDIYATTGAQYRAVVREFTTTANSSGQITVQFTTVTDNASISGIEILR